MGVKSHCIRKDTACVLGAGSRGPLRIGPTVVKVKGSDKVKAVTNTHALHGK